MPIDQIGTAGLANGAVVPADLSTGAPYWDTSGNVGIGLTAGGSKLNVLGNAELRGPQNGTATAVVTFLKGADGTQAGYWGFGGTSTPMEYVNSRSTGHIWYNGTSAHMYLDGSGNVGIGTSSPSQRLQVNGNIQVSSTNSINFFDTNYFVRASSGLELQSNDLIRFLTNGANERVRIDSGGNVIVNGSTGTGRFRVFGGGTTSSTWTTIFYDSGGNQMFSQRDDGAIYLGAKAASPYNLTTANAANANLGTDGFFYRSTSSLKYKRDVQDAKHGLAEVLALRPVTYKGKSAADGDTVFGGLIAEEVHASGLTEFVQYAEDGTPDAIAYGNMVSLAFKAIQEQQAMIEELKAKVAALEAK